MRPRFTERFSVGLTPELHAELLLLADKLERSRESMARVLIVEGLKARRSRTSADNLPSRHRTSD